MLDPTHTSVPMLIRGNALVLKTPVENAPRTSIEKHLSWTHGPRTSLQQRLFHFTDHVQQNISPTCVVFYNSVSLSLSFVEMCIVSCLSASQACVCGRGAATWGCPRCCLPCSCDSPPSFHVWHTQQLDAGKTDVLSSANGPCTATLQQRCHHTST